MNKETYWQDTTTCWSEPDIDHDPPSEEVRPGWEALSPWEPYSSFVDENVTERYGLPDGKTYYVRWKRQLSKKVDLKDLEIS